MSDSTRKTRKPKAKPAGPRADAKRWQDENDAAFRYYNAFVEEHGLFSDTYRAF